MQIVDYKEKRLFIEYKTENQKIRKPEIYYKRKFLVFAFYASSLVINIMMKESKSRAEDTRIARSCKYLIH